MKTKEQWIEFVRENTPFAIRPVKKAKTTLVSPFISNHAMQVVCECIGKQYLKNLKPNRNDNY